MGTVTLWMQISLDGFVAGPNGELDWPIVDEEVHQYFNDQLRDVDTFLYGRKVYEGMAAFWPNAHEIPSSTARHLEYAEIWKPMAKIVFSRTLQHADWNTTVVGDDLAGAVAQLKEEPETAHVLFGGGEIAATFIELDLVDEYRLFVHPVLLGAGQRLFGALDARATLSLVEARTFDGAVVHMHHKRAQLTG
jgi:dihydrofolate reductase